LILSILLFCLSTICRNCKFETLHGCSPLLCTCVINTFYLFVIPWWGTAIMSERFDIMSTAMNAYMIYQLCFAGLVVLHLIYRVLLRKKLVSSHIMEMENHLFTIDDQELNRFRQEIINAKKNSPGPNTAGNTGMTVTLVGVKSN